MHVHVHWSYLLNVGYWKAIYDKFGEEGLKRGIPDTNGGK